MAKAKTEKKKFRIAFVEYFLNLQLEGGSMFSLDLYARELIKRGHDISVLTITSKRNDLGRERKLYRMIEENCNNSNPIILDKEAQRIMQKYEGQFDFYHVHNPWLLPAAAAYRKNGGKAPVVADLNTYMFCTNFAVMDGECHKSCGLYKRVIHSDFPVLKKLASIPVRAYQQHGLDILGKYVDRFFPVSPFAEKIFVEYGLPKEKMMMIPDGFDLNVFRASGVTRHLTSRVSTFNIICPSRFDYTKGVDIAVKAVAELKNRGISNINLHIVGNDGSEKGNIMKLTDELRLSNCIIFHGHLTLKQLLFIYSNCQLFVHPARWFETFGRTIIEAMAFGLPCVVSSKGALSWVADGGGLVFESGNAADLADKIEKIYKDEKLRASLSKKALVRVKDFDVKYTIDGFEKAYEKLFKDK